MTGGWSLEKISDEVYRTKLVDVADVIANWIREFGPLEGSRVLDFGCGEGTMALGLALRHAPSQVVGVEIHGEINRCAQFAREQLGLEEMPSNLLLARIEESDNLSKFGLFDVVYSWSVFEHVRQELIAEFLVKLKRCLKPNGLMFL